MAMTRWISVMLFATAVFGAAFGIAGVPKDSPIFGQPRRTVPFVHQKCPEAKKSCVRCHPQATTSKWSSMRLVPPMETCAPCHEAAKGASLLTPPTAACRQCHATIQAGAMPRRSEHPRTNLRFSHKAHAKTACNRCHPKSAVGALLDGPLDVIDMKQCFDCHGDSSCRICHIVNKTGTMNTTINGRKLYPPTWLKGPTHGEGWAGDHASEAGSDSPFCASCHEERFCRDCHSGARRPRNIHPGDWLTTHGVSTRLDNPRCKGCHRKQTFCLSCHRRSGVAPDSPANARASDRGGGFHQGMDTPELMRRAKHDVTSCVSCHSESTCVSCHVRINPHPSDFKRKCRALVRRNRQACTKCHTNDVARFCR